MFILLPRMTELDKFNSEHHLVIGKQQATCLPRYINVIQTTVAVDSLIN